MYINLLGIKQLDFKAEDNSPIKGTQLFYSHKEEGVVGERTDKMFLRDGFPLPEVTPGDTLDITYNRHGKPESIRVVSDKQSIK